MKRKKYEVAGMMEWHLEFKVGRTLLHIPFTGGHLCSGAHTVAVYETSDPVVQAVIEKSVAFRTGRIRLASELEIPDASAEPKNAQGADLASNMASDPKVSCLSGGTTTKDGKYSSLFVLEYKTEEEVFEFLHRKKGVPTARLCTPDSYKTEAEKLGIILKKID